MTVAELITELNKYDENLEVVGYWEGITTDIREVRIKPTPTKWRQHYPNKLEYVELDVDTL